MTHYPSDTTSAHIRRVYGGTIVVTLHRPKGEYDVHCADLPDALTVAREAMQKSGALVERTLHTTLLETARATLGLKGFRVDREGNLWLVTRGGAR